MTITFRSTLVALCVVLVLIPSPGYAQLQPLGVGMRARVSSAKTISEGKVIHVRGDTVWLSSRGTSATVSLREADSVWIRRSHGGRGALIGGVAGGLVAGGFLAFLAHGLCEVEDCSSAAPTGFLIGGALGGGAGAVLGYIAGSLSRYWKPVPLR